MLLQLKRKCLHKQQGYALFQLGIILALMIVICTLSLPRLSFLQHRLVRTEVEKMMLMFRYLQRLAIARNQDQHLVLFPDKGWYEGAGHREYFPEGVCFGLIPGAYGPPSNPQKVLTSPITYKDNQVTFYAYGTIQPGTLYLADKNRQVMYALSTAVSPIAHMRAYRYNAANNKWVAL